MKTRRDFVQAVPFAAAAVLAACGGKPPEPTAAPAPAPQPEPAPAPAPAPAPEAAAPAAAAPADAASLPMLDPGEATAKALGYVPDSTTVDASQWPTHVAGNACSGCTLYSGAPGSASGPCSLFPGKQVMATGWCSGFIKKPA